MLGFKGFVVRELMINLCLLNAYHGMNILTIYLWIFHSCLVKSTSKAFHQCLDVSVRAVQQCTILSSSADTVKLWLLQRADVISKFTSKL